MSDMWLHGIPESCKNCGELMCDCPNYTQDDVKKVLRGQRL